MQKYDVVLYDVHFDDTDGSKHRPIIILDVENDYAVATSCTTHEPRNHFFGEYVLQDYKQAGLKKPTTARLSKIVDVDESMIIRRLGKLSVRDIENIETLLYGEVQINSSYNEVNNNRMILDESLFEDEAVVNEKTIEPEDNGISMIINNLIRDEYDTIDAYNSAITTFKDIGNSDDAISVLNDIVSEENVHVGQLQRLMELFDPNADKVADGVEEADRQIDDSLDMSDEEFLEKFVEWYDPAKGNSSNYDTSTIPNYSNSINESVNVNNTVDLSCSNCSDDADDDEFLKGFEEITNR